MQNKFTLLFVLCVIVLFMSCGDPGSETAPAEPAADAAAIETGPDSTVVDANHYTAEFENDRVRIVRIAYGPGEESVMHYHPESVAVYLTDAHVEMVLPNGETVKQQSQAGQHELTPAGQHLPKNIGEAPLELILIELKSGANSAAIPDGQDSIALDPDHYTAEFENDKVRILRITYGSGEESVMHYHPDSVAVFLTEHRAHMTAPDGSTAEAEAAAGSVLFSPAGQHLPKNVSEGPLELILVELK
jgi:quercetin dioxygenase-like cupin family protein